MAQPTLFEDHTVVADCIRIFIITVGFTIAMTAVKLGIRAVRERDWEKTAGLICVAALVLNPAVNGLYRFDQPLQAVGTCIYLAGLVAGLVALSFKVTFWHRDWLTRRQSHDNREQDRRDRR